MFGKIEDVDDDAKVRRHSDELFLCFGFVFCEFGELKIETLQQH